MKLSILVCTMPERSIMFNALYNKISKQIEKFNENEVEILSNNRLDITTGEKRNLLITESVGDFIVFVDDDDDVYDYYVEEILNAINQNNNVDCIGINGIITFNGQNERKWFISKEYKHWHEIADIYYRTPNHISPIRRSIAISTPFPNQHHGEDFAFSMAVLPHLQNEIKIEKPLYHYQSRATLNPHIENGAPYRPAWR